MIKLNELFDQISIDDQKIVVELVNEFELLWLKSNSTNSSQKPDIDSVFQQAKQRCSSKMAVQSALTQFLLLDIDYRIDRNETPRPEDYLQHFPSEEAVIRNCFEIQQVDGNYQRIGRLAEGGLGVVSIAHDRSLNRRVAYKELRDVYAHDPSKQARFKREAEITGRLQHPGIVAIYNFEESWDGSARYVMPLIEGEQFARAIERFHSRRISGQSSVIDRSELRKLLKSYVVACQTVAYAHSQNIVHRDIKPQNILLGKFGETIIVDWGLAKCIVEPEPSNALKSSDPAINDTLVDAADVTQTGEVFGTPMFMSPEQASASFGLVGPKSDIYSLGVTLYFLLTGQLPFKGEKVDELLSAIIKGEFRKPREVLAQVPPALEAICLKCMSHTPSGPLRKTRCNWH